MIKDLQSDESGVILFKVVVEHILEYRRDYKIVFRIPQNNKKLEIYLPFRYFGYHTMKKGEVYNFILNPTFEDIYGDIVYNYSLSNDECNFNLYYYSPMFANC
jgi:hypothetical protein